MDSRPTGNCRLLSLEIMARDRSLNEAFMAVGIDERGDGRSRHGKINSSIVARRAELYRSIAHPVTFDQGRLLAPDLPAPTLLWAGPNRGFRTEESRFGGRGSQLLLLGGDHLVQNIIQLSRNSPAWKM